MNIRRRHILALVFPALALGCSPQSREGATDTNEATTTTTALA